MRKLLTAVVAFGFIGSFAAACDYHKNQHVTASAEQARPSVAISTHDGMLPPIADDAKQVADAAKPAVCAEGDKACAPGSE